MKPTGKYAVVLVTAPDMKIARRLARAALAARLIACANLLRKIESGAEVLLVLKTATARLAALEKLIVAEHPYDSPEFLVLPISRGTKRYLDWVGQSVEETA